MLGGYNFPLARLPLPGHLIADRKSLAFDLYDMDDIASDGALLTMEPERLSVLLISTTERLRLLITSCAVAPCKGRGSVLIEVKNDFRIVSNSASHPRILPVQGLLTNAFDTPLAADSGVMTSESLRTADGRIDNRLELTAKLEAEAGSSIVFESVRSAIADGDVGVMIGEVGSEGPELDQGIVGRSALGVGLMVPPKASGAASCTTRLIVGKVFLTYALLDMRSSMSAKCKSVFRRIIE